MQPRTLRRPRQRREIRVAMHGSPQDAIGKLAHDSNIFLLTFGQFSLTDALIQLLRTTGPVDVDISTWTAANANLERSMHLLQTGNIRSIRFLLDTTVYSRQPAYAHRLRELFGDARIRMIKTHAKFVTLHNDKWTISITPSQNLNEENRVETIDISTCPDLYQFLTDTVDHIFATVNQHYQPTLPTIEQGDLIPPCTRTFLPDPPWPTLGKAE